MSGWQDLCRMVVGLSYMGDIRMGLAEDSKKVDRIATSSSAGLRDIYLPMLRVSYSPLGCFGLKTYGG